MPYALPPPRALLCIERPEEMGRLNIEPAKIRVVGLSEGPNDNPEATLIGGQNVCFKVHGATGKVEVRFSYPYLGPDEKATEWTASFSVKISGLSSNYELFVDPNQPANDQSWVDSGWHNMWKFEPVSTFCRAKPKWPRCPDPGD
jgi:hypothetical protein